MKIVVVVSNNSGGQWEEYYSCPDNATDDQILGLIESMFDRFNATLRPNESPRTVVGVYEEQDKAEFPEHSWEELVKHNWEKSNLVTILQLGGGSYDTVRCAKCGATGKRYGLSDARIIIDKKFVNKPCKL